jgi:hypothetical protein
MSKRYYNHLPDELKPQVKASNAKTLIFDTPDGKGLDSTIKCMTASGDTVGASATFTMLHMSEFALWQGDKKSMYSTLMQSVPKTRNSMVIIESTARGYDEFKTMWDKAIAGDNDFEPLFFAWHEMDSYREYYDGFELTPYEREIKAKYNLDNEQLAWRRWCIRNNCFDDEDNFKQEYPSCREEAFLSTGNCAYDSEKVNKRMSEIPIPIKVGNFVYKYDGLQIYDIQFEEDRKGYVRIYEEALKGYPYVIGGDTAGEGSDNFIGQVLDNISGKQVAVLEQKVDEDIYARQMYCLGYYYNKALIGIETNFSTHPQKELERLKYPHLYEREREDTFTGNMVKAFGFKTTTITRPIIIATLVSIVRERVSLLNDRTTLNEMLTFVKNEKGRAEAMQGEHDDHVMALAIAYYVRNSRQQRFTVQEEEITVRKFKKPSWAIDSNEEMEEKTRGAFMIW